MKKLILPLLLLYAPLVLASKPNPSDYPIAVHVQCSYLRGEIGPYQQRVGVTLDGKPVELTAYVRFPVPLPMGDYKARFVKGHGPHALDFYELLLPNGKTTRFSVSGFGPNVCSVPPQ